jgi:EmrB/QacA subfamily drug resistance transporter
VSETPSPLSPAERRARLAAFGGVLAVLFLSSLNMTVVGTALPRIIAELNGFELYAWAFTAFSLTSTVTLPIYGRLSDRVGRRPVLLGGIVAFALASAAAGLSQSMLQLVVFRALQGVGGGALISMSWAAIGDLFPPRERGRYQGWTGAVFGVSSVIGPLVGGLITDGPGWRWVFLVNLPVAAVAFELVRRYLPRAPRRPGQGIDLAGAALLVASVLPLLLVGGRLGAGAAASDPAVLGLIAVALVSGAAFVAVQLRSSHPTFEPALFADATYRRGNLAAFLTGVGLFGAVIYLPLFVQGVQGGSAAASGLVLAPMMAGVVLGSTLSGWLASRTGRYRRWIVLGVALMAAGFLASARFSPDAPAAWVMAWMVVLGAGIGPTNSLLTLAVQNALPEDKLGAATSANQFFRQIGGTLGVGVFGAVITARVRAGLPDLLQGAGPLPDGAVATLADPNLLTDPARLAAVRATLAPTLGSDGVARVEAALRQLLGQGVSEVFLLSLIIAVVALLVVVRLPPAELRGDASASDDATTPTLTAARAHD